MTADLPLNSERSEFQHPEISTNQAEQLTRFAQLLQTANKVMNLTRIQEKDAIYLRHFGDALQAKPVLQKLGTPGALLDIGSGPGVPGLVLACALPDWQVTSLEATGKKVQFQKSVVEALALANAKVLQGRAEELGHKGKYREQFDVVTARALAAMPILLELAMPFVRPGGILVAYKGSDVETELDQSQSALETLACAVDRIVPYSLQALAEEMGGAVPSEKVQYHLVIIRKNRSLDRKYPRAYGVIRRKPL